MADKGVQSPASNVPAATGLDLDAAIFRRLIRNEHAAGIGRRIGLPSKTVANRVGRMARLGYIKEVAPGARPALYQRGPRATEFEALIESAISDRRVRSALPLAGRLHHLRFVWKIESSPSPAAVGDAAGPRWTRTWHASGVQCFEMDVQQRGRTYVVRETRGKSKSSFRVTAPEEYVSDPAMLDLAERQVLHEVADLLRDFAKEHGYVLDKSGLQVSGGSEVGLPVAEWVPKFGRAGEPVTVDASVPPRELDIRPKGIVAAVLGLPRDLEADRAHQAATTARLGAVEARLDAEEELHRRVLSALERSIGLHHGHTLAALALTEAQVKSGPAPAPSPVPSPLPVSSGVEYA